MKLFDLAGKGSLKLIIYQIPHLMKIKGGDVLVFSSLTRQ